MLRKKFKNKGFTLIEIIVVIVILAVLMAIAVPSVMSYMNEGQKAKYETIARAAFINTQIGVAEDIAKDGKADDCLGVAKWVDAYKDAKTNYGYYGSKKNYGDSFDNMITFTIALSGDKGSSNCDVKAATYYIKLKGVAGFREVNVTANGKMTVADSNISRVPGHGTAIEYS